MTKINKILFIILLEAGYLGYTAFQEYIPFDVAQMKAAIKNSPVVQRQAEEYREEQKCIKAKKENCSISVCNTIIPTKPLEKNWKYTHPIYKNFEDFDINDMNDYGYIFNFFHKQYVTETISQAR